jgi:hypothetical protein
MTDKVTNKSEIEDIPIEKELHHVPSLNLKSDAQDIDPVLEKALLRKTDLHLVPILFVLFLCAFIDR